MAQAEIVARNIQHHLDNESLEVYAPTNPPAIHLTLGIVSVHAHCISVKRLAFQHYSDRVHRPKM